MSSATQKQIDATGRTLTTVHTVPFRDFRFTTSSDRPRRSVRCLRCGWVRRGNGDDVWKLSDTHKCKPGQFDYVRGAYGVPAARGRRITYDGIPGRITSAKGAYVVVRFDEPHFSYGRQGACHPTSCMVYHTPWGDFDFSQAQWEKWFGR
jgi:hypothetical protein